MLSPTIVPVSAIAMMAISAVLALFFPLVLFLVLRRKRRMRVVPLLIGMLTFPLFVFVLESLAHAAVFSNAAAAGFLQRNWWAYALYGGVMAGIFEESGRLCAFRFVLRRKYNSLGGALSYGIGHGWIEAIVLCALPMVTSVALALTFNVGGNPPESAVAFAQGVQQNLASGGAALYLASGLERVIAVTIHVALSVLVWLAATGRGPRKLFFLSILMHTLVNCPAGMYQSGLITNIWIIEGLTALLVAVFCVVTALIYEKCAQTYTALLDYHPVDFSM